MNRETAEEASKLIMAISEIEKDIESLDWNGLYHINLDGTMLNTRGMEILPLLKKKLTVAENKLKKLK